VKLSRVVFQICERTDRQTDTLITLTCASPEGESIIFNCCKSRGIIVNTQHFSSMILLRSKTAMIEDVGRQGIPCRSSGQYTTVASGCQAITSVPAILVIVQRLRSVHIPQLISLHLTLILILISSHSIRTEVAL